MTLEEINKIVRSYLKQSEDNLEVENPKCDFKTQWYDLSKKAGVNEFLKDTSALANTFGLDGLIIIGYDTKTKKYYDTKFKDCNLSDTSKITDLINKKIDRLFDISVNDIVIDKHTLSVIHIPPSIDKPHVITNYQTFDKDGKIKKEEQHKIFVRKGTATYPASKNDIELMFYDRKNIIPEFKIQSSFHYKSISLHVPYNDIDKKFNDNKSLCIRSLIPITLENLGMRPVSIIKINFNLYLFEDANEREIINLESDDEYLLSPIILARGHIINLSIKFMSCQFRDIGYEYVCDKIIEFNRNNKHLLTNSILLTLSTGKQISSELTISTI